jgi:hypothetical protein
MARLTIIFFASAAATFANPTVESQYALVAENVLVGVTADGAVVSGNYRFHTFPDVMRTWGPPPRPFIVYLPVPVPAELKGFDEIEAIVHPVAVINGVRCAPNNRAGHFNVAALPRNVKMTVFVFDAYGLKIGDEVNVQIQYDQPILAVGGKQLIYYLPFLPKFEKYHKQMRLDPRDYVIHFESHGGVLLRLLTPVSVITQAEPTAISVLAKDMELIAVERLPSQSSDPALAPGRLPAGQEPRPH